MSQILQIAVLISGGGRTLQNLMQRRTEGLPIDIRLVLSSNSKAKGLEFAREDGIETISLRRRDFDTPESFRDAVFEPIRRAGAQYVVMAGFLQHVLIPADFENRVLNIHPGLIPAFCGKGFYGHHVHEAVLEYGAKVSGCTVHFVDDDYDHGPIILQRTVAVREDDTPETLAGRVFDEECIAYPEALRLIAEGRVTVEDNRRVRIRS